MRAEVLKNSRELDLMSQEQLNSKGTLFQHLAGDRQDLLCPKGDGEEKVTGNVGEGLVRHRMA